MVEVLNLIINGLPSKLCLVLSTDTFKVPKF